MSDKKEQIIINLEEGKLTLTSFTPDQLVTIGFLELAKKMLLDELIIGHVPKEVSKPNIVKLPFPRKTNDIN